MTHSQVYLHCRLNKGSDRKSWGSSPHEHDNELGTYWSTSSFPSTRQNYKSISRDSSIKPTGCHWAFHHLFGLIIKDSVMLKLGSGRKGLRALLGSVLNWKASPWYNSLWLASFGEESRSIKQWNPCLYSHFYSHSTASSSTPLQSSGDTGHRNDLFNL